MRFPNAASVLESEKYVPAFTNVAMVHVFCRSAHTGGDHYCNFRAGGGAYVSGTGRVFVYGVEHFDDLMVRVREFPAGSGGGSPSDIVWRSSNGDSVIWPGGIAPGYWLSALGSGWQVAGIGDFTGDGKSDILWRSVNGDNVIWPGGIAPGYWLSALDGTWQVQGVGDFDGNGESDILWRCLPQAPATSCGNAIVGSVAIWHFSQGNYGWTTWPGALDGTWHIYGVGHFH